MLLWMQMVYIADNLDLALYIARKPLGVLRSEAGVANTPPAVTGRAIFFKVRFLDYLSFADVTYTFLKPNIALR